ncbi:MAG TPA: transglutaminase domain-containing protein [Gemmataceae bacterium]|nr:transglutaminase domain-containing protein [Gemmataceae bacterium]
MRRSVLLVSAFACLFVLVLSAPGFVRGDEQEAQKLAQQALQLLGEKKYDQAIEAIHKAIQMAPSNDRYLMIASESERRAGRFAEGVKDALAAIKINDNNGLYYALVAANAYGNEEPELALEYCRKVIAMGPKKAGQSVYNDAKAYEDMLVKKMYTITWNLDPSKRQAPGNTIAVALPKGDLPYQSVSVEVKGAKSHRIIKGESNDMMRVVPNGDKPFQVITKVTVQPVSYKAKLAKAGNGSLPVNARAYLGAGEGFNPASPVLKKIAAEVKGKNSVETVKNILAWLHKNIKYKEETSNITKLDFKTVDEIVERGHAECRGYTVLFTALCRAAGVPARPVWGVLFLPKGFSSHNWDEVYIAGVGWVPVDPQKVETFGWLPINRVRMFMDLRKSSKSDENLPLLNLMYMNGEKLQYEQSR